MREIKFRAWDKNIEVMIDPENLHLDGSGLVAVYYQNCDAEESLWETDPLVLGNVKLMQHTGLKDKNGKEIYEGDIFKITQKPEEINSVTFYFGSWHLEEHGLHLEDWYDKGEVIGNIYENKELLEV